MFQVIVTNPNKLGSPFISEFSTQEEAQAWIDNCSNKPSKPWGEIGEFEIDGPNNVSAQIEQESTNVQALAYLASTDWLIVREFETGVSCPEEIKALRQDARDSIVR